MTFRERYLAGEIPFEKIDDYVEEWNNSEDMRTLREYLGLTAEEEDVWIDDSDEALMELLEKKGGRGNDFFNYRRFPYRQNPAGTEAS